MDQSYIPQGYAPRLNLYDTQKAIGLLKRLFEDTLGGALIFGMADDGQIVGRCVQPPWLHGAQGQRLR